MPEEDREFMEAAALLPRSLRGALEVFPAAKQGLAEELRLRAGFPVSVLLPGGEECASRTPVESRELDAVLEIATQGSAYAAVNSLRQGFITVRGGHRVGVCGEAVVKGGEICGFRELSSISVRVAREHRNAADTVLGGLLSGCRTPPGVLVAAPPGAGKTTLLRCLIRRLSEGAEGLEPQRVAVADERGELAAVWKGRAQFDLGPRTDIISGAPKAEASLMLLRAMNPQVIAVDEITAPEDVAALTKCANCGVRLLATAHADSLDDLKRRPMYSELLEMNIFSRFVFIENRSGIREARVC